LDKNTAIGLTLIFILMAGWFYFTMPDAEEIEQRKREAARQDSIAAAEQLKSDDEDFPIEVEDQPAVRERQQRSAPVGMFADASIQDTIITRVETPYFIAEFTNLGAGPRSYQLKRHNTWSGSPVEMIHDSVGSVYNVGFLSTENYNVETRDILFQPVDPNKSNIVLEEGNKELSYTLEVGDGRQIIYTYTFFADRYEMDLDIRFIGVSDYIIGRSVDFGWTVPLRSTEKDPKQDGMGTSAYIYAADELEQFKLTEPGADEFNFNGTIDWVATKTKFFSQIIKPVTQANAARLTGSQTGEQDDVLTRHNYTSAVQSPIPSDGKISYRLFVGPLTYEDTKAFDPNAFKMVEVGYNWMRFFSDPFVRFAVIPFFDLLNGFIPNYGLIIIIFAIVIKLILSPLTLRSYKSMANMRELQPQMKELQEKYKDNPQKQQQETLKLYRKAKVNPLGGCLPMLLQFPILITLWRFFQNSIILRQEEFLWASDLSAPDYIINLPFAIPFLGDSIAGFVLLMTGAMIVQSRITGGMGGGAGAAANPQMKVFQYILPVMLLFIFNNFAAGLSLYYLIFNILSIGQQFYLNKSIHNKKLAEAKS
jgi:YidC/Oxa1 family membrane protein insertase